MAYKHSLIIDVSTGGDQTTRSRVGSFTENYYANARYITSAGNPAVQLAALISARAALLAPQCKISGIRVGEVEVGARLVYAKGKSIINGISVAGTFGSAIPGGYVDTPSAAIQAVCNHTSGNTLKMVLKGMPDNAFSRGEANTATVNDPLWQSYFTALAPFFQVVRNLSAASAPISTIKTTNGVTIVKLAAALAVNPGDWVRVLRTNLAGRRFPGKAMYVTDVDGRDVTVEGWDNPDTTGGTLRIDSLTTANYEPANCRVVGRVKATIGRPFFVLRSRSSNRAN